MAQRRPRKDSEALRLEVGAALSVFVSLRVRVDVRGGVVRLRGVAPSRNIIREAVKLAAAVEGVERVENELFVPDDYQVASSVQQDVPQPTVDASLETLQEDGFLPPEDTPGLQEEVGSSDWETVIEDFDEPYTPAVDPVVEPTGDGIENLQVVGGFATTALDNADDQAFHEPNVPHSDDEVQEDVQLALARDAATNGLDVYVEVDRGIAHLTGKVTSMDEVDIVEEVVRRVPQVLDVENDLLIEGVH